MFVEPQKMSYEALNRHFWVAAVMGCALFCLNFNTYAQKQCFVLFVVLFSDFV